MGTIAVNGGARKIPGSRLGAISTLAFLALAVIGLGFTTGVGSLCAFGCKTVSAVCPLGAIEAVIASRSILPWVVISVAVIALLSIALGRVFCAWICPIPTLRSWIIGPGKKDGGAATATAPEPAMVGKVAPSEFHPDRRSSKISLDSRHFVLGGALVSTALFGFPVFCLICPIGLVSATLVGIWRLFQYNEPSWTLLIFPGVLVVELVACRTWCRRFCPLGALLSLLSALNIFMRPKVKGSACLRISRGMDCTLCRNACPEEIDLHHVKESQPLAECTKCRRCADACQAGAISFPVLPRSDKRRDSEAPTPLSGNAFR